MSTQAGNTVPAATAAGTANGAPSKETGGLTAKQLKEKKKAEKRAKRAAERGDSAGAAVSGGTGAAAPVATATGGAVPGGSQKKQSNMTTAVQGAGGAAVSREKALHLFAHLEIPQFNSVVMTADLREIHPTVLQLATQIASHRIIGSTSRAREMMLAFRQFIADYKGTPQGVTLSRHMSLLLSTQIDFLRQARPLGVSMGNCIRWLKQAITSLPIDLTDDQAKEELDGQIVQFIRERIDVAGKVISLSVYDVLGDEEVILTYGHSEVVVNALIFANSKQDSKKLRVIVVDAQPLFEGKRTLRKLVDAGINCTYVPLSALTFMLREVTQVILGAHAMLSNGRLFSRVGTAAVATAASSRGLPVTVLCETIKFSPRVQLDAVTYNELGPLVPEGKTQGANKVITLNVLFDLTPQNAINKVITEVGSLPASSVPVILREYKV